MPARRSGTSRCSSKTPPSEKFVGITNSDLAFTGNYVIQGSYNGYQVWDITEPEQADAARRRTSARPRRATSRSTRICSSSPAGSLRRGSTAAREGVKDTVSKERLRGIRIFDISDIANPKNVGNVQTCRGSHTHTVLVDPKDTDNVYVYISGSAGVRSPKELPGCSNAMPSDKDPNSALFRIEVIKVPLAHPEQAAIVSSPRIFNGLDRAAASRRDTGRTASPNAKEIADGEGDGRVHVR